MFDRDQFIADLRGTLSERSRKATAEVVARAVSDPASIMRQLGEPDKPGVQVLLQSPELTVLLWLGHPKQVALPHDHRLSAVIGMYAGREDHMLWRRVPDAKNFQIEPVGGEALGVGNVTVLGRDIVHSVVNPLDKISAGIQVYDGDFFAVQRSMWDAETLVEKPYSDRVVAKGMPVVGR